MTRKTRGATYDHKNVIVVFLGNSTFFRDERYVRLCTPDNIYEKFETQRALGRTRMNFSHLESDTPFCVEVI